MATDPKPQTAHEIDFRPLEVWPPVESGEVSDLQGVAAIYDAQRAKCPVAWTDPGHGEGYWTVLAHKDVTEVVRDPQRFSSAVPKYGDPLIPIEIDPPLHTQYRALLSRLINPSKMKVFEDDIREYAGRLMDEALASPEPDLLSVTSTIPLRVFCLLLGTPDDVEWRRIKEMTEDLHNRKIPTFSADPEHIAARQAASVPRVEYCKKRIAHRRAEPGDDLVSDILAGQIDGRDVTDDEALRILSLLYLAGHRTTANSMAGIVVELARNPAIFQRLQEEPEKIPAAVEELLRVETVLHIMPRYCTQDTTLGGQTIRAGEQVYPAFGAANLDSGAIKDAATIDIDRKPNRHMAFGLGVHVCAGAPLARLQLRVFIEELLARVESMELDGTVTREKWPRFGPTQLPLKVKLKG